MKFFRTYGEHVGILKERLGRKVGEVCHEVRMRWGRRGKNGQVRIWNRGRKPLVAGSVYKPGNRNLAAFSRELRTKEQRTKN